MANQINQVNLFSSLLSPVHQTDSLTALNSHSQLNNSLLASAITSRIVPYITTLAGNQLRAYDENNNGLHNLNNLSSFGLMNGGNMSQTSLNVSLANSLGSSLNSSMNSIGNNLGNSPSNMSNGLVMKTTNEHLESILQSSKSDLKTTKLETKKEDEHLHFNHLNGPLKSPNFSLLYPPSNFNLTSLLKN